MCAFSPHSVAGYYGGFSQATRDIAAFLKFGSCADWTLPVWGTGSQSCQTYKSVVEHYSSHCKCCCQTAGYFRDLIMDI